MSVIEKNKESFKLYFYCPQNESASVAGLSGLLKRISGFSLISSSAQNEEWTFSHKDTKVFYSLNIEKIDFKKTENGYVYTGVYISLPYFKPFFYALSFTGFAMYLAAKFNWKIKNPLEGSALLTSDNHQNKKAIVQSWLALNDKVVHAMQAHSATIEHLPILSQHFVLKWYTYSNAMHRIKLNHSKDRVFVSALHIAQSETQTPFLFLNAVELVPFVLLPDTSIIYMFKKGGKHYKVICKSEDWINEFRENTTQYIENKIEYYLFTPSSNLSKLKNFVDKLEKVDENRLELLHSDLLLKCEIDLDTIEEIAVFEPSPSA